MHFHSDRAGGLPAVRAAGIRAVGSPLTCTLARQGGLPVPEALASMPETTVAIRPGIALYFPGAGHSRDNIVAWLPGPRVLFGGCFLKSSTNSDLGYVADADIRAWPVSVRRLRARYGAYRVAVPGHGAVAGDAVGHTLPLLTA